MTAVTSEQATDAQLIGAWRGGEEAAAATLVRRHAAAIGRFLGARGAGGDVLDDLVQETFIKAFRGMAGWRGDGSFLGWLLRIAGNLHKDRYRRRGGRVFVAIEDDDRVDLADPAAELEASETAERIRAGLDNLTPMQREVFLLRVEEGLGYEVIAESLGSTPGAARVHYHNAVKRLRELVEE
jgi:RNA polymerase sigma-70 factor (ECF subfamily)